MSELSHTLIMGSSATGKSTTASVLKSRGLACIDADYDEGIAYWQNKKTGEEEAIPDDPPESWGAEHYWRWKIDVLAAHLAEADRPVYVCGTAGNRSEAYDLFKCIIVLSADKLTLEHRLATREHNNFGKLPHERDWALAERDRVVAEARSRGHLIIDTSSSTPEEVADIIVNVS
jgi:broad-specificity NMP kinase